MKKLTCEMCGSTDLMKDGGVFVCQSCGCKYSVEEAKKMMVEGIVEVAGTVKVDETDKTDNYLNLSKSAYDSGNGQDAFDYANKALEISAKNPKAWIAKMKAIPLISTIGEPKTNEIIEAGKNAVAFADDASKSEIMFEVYSFEARESLSMLKIATKKTADTQNIKKIYREFCSIDFQSATKKTSKYDEDFLILYNKFAEDALSMIKLIPDDALVDYPEIANIVGECAKQYQYLTNAVIERFQIYNFRLSKSAVTVRENHRVAIEDKVKTAKKIVLERKEKEQTERNSKYWADHAEEKASLESEQENLNSQISALKESLNDQVYALNKEISNLPGKAEIDNIEERITALYAEMASLGVFKGKEKKAIQARIDQAKVEKKGVQDRMDAERSAIKSKISSIKDDFEKKISPLQNRLSEVNTELTKAR